MRISACKSAASPTQPWGTHQQGQAQARQTYTTIGTPFKHIRKHVIVIVLLVTVVIVVVSVIVVIVKVSQDRLCRIAFIGFWSLLFLSLLNDFRDAFGAILNQKSIKVCMRMPACKRDRNLLTTHAFCIFLHMFGFIFERKIHITNRIEFGRRFWERLLEPPRTLQGQKRWFCKIKLFFCRLTFRRPGASKLDFGSQNGAKIEPRINQTS